MLLTTPIEVSLWQVGRSCVCVEARRPGPNVCNSISALGIMDVIWATRNG